MFALLSKIGGGLLAAGKAVVGGCLSFIQSAGALIVSAANSVWAFVTGIGIKVGGWIGITKTATVAAAAIPAAVAVEGAVAAGVAEGAVILPAVVGGEALAVAGAEAMALPVVAATATGMAWWTLPLTGLGAAALILVSVSLGRVLYQIYQDGNHFCGLGQSIKTLIFLPGYVVMDMWDLVAAGVSKTWNGVSKVGGWIKTACTWSWTKVKGVGSKIAGWFRSGSPIAEGGLARDMGLLDDPDIKKVDPDLGTAPA